METPARTCYVLVFTACSGHVNVQGSPSSMWCLIYFFTVKEEEVPEIKEPELPIIPNYLSNPPFMYSKMDNKAELILAQLTQNGNGDHSSDDPHSDSASLSPTHEQQLPQQPQSLLSDTPSPREGAFIPLAQQNGVSPSPASSLTVNGGLPMDISMEPHLVNHGEYPHSVAHNGAVCSPPLPSPSPSTTSSSSQAQVANANPSMTRQQSLPQQLNCGQGAGGNMPAFQPFFFTSTFPVNVQGKDGRHTANVVVFDQALI